MYNQDGNIRKVILVESGGCSYVQKARNIQQVGGDLALVYNQKWKKTETLMSDDGSGAGIKIPAVLVQNKEGTILKDKVISLLKT